MHDGGAEFRRLTGVTPHRAKATRLFAEPFTPYSAASGGGKRRAANQSSWSLPEAGLVLAVIAAVAAWFAYDHQQQAAALQRHPYPYSNCDEARVDGVSSFSAGDPRYTPRQDGDSDGVACEPYR